MKKLAKEKESGIEKGYPKEIVLEVIDDELFLLFPYKPSYICWFRFCRQ